MVQHKCDRCLKSWIRKGDYTRHINRKNKCDIVVINEEKPQIENNDTKSEIQDMKKILKNVVDVFLKYEDNKKTSEETDVYNCSNDEKNNKKTSEETDVYNCNNDENNNTSNDAEEINIPKSIAINKKFTEYCYEGKYELY
jgi:uncharacterized C2H2 Zn-finger protein